MPPNHHCWSLTMKIRALLAAIVACMLTGLGAYAQTDSAATRVSAPELTPLKPLRPVTSVYTLEAGGTHLADTYLTPLIYKGYSLALGYERWQAMKFDPEKWVMRLAFRGEWDDADSPAGNASMWYAGLDARWAMMRRWNIMPGFTAGVGGATGIAGGCMYNGRNGNNPASAKVQWTVDAAGYVAWNGRIGRLPVTASYLMTLPVTGAFFGPEYGELYYEIWLGNTRNLAHWAHWGNYFAMDNLLALDLHLGSTSLRVGYRGRVLSTNVSHLTTRITSNTFVLGLSGEWMSLDARRKDVSDPKIIHALY